MRHFVGQQALQLALFVDGQRIKNRVRRGPRHAKSDFIAHLVPAERDAVVRDEAELRVAALPSGGSDGPGAGNAARSPATGNGVEGIGMVRGSTGAGATRS